MSIDCTPTLQTCVEPITEPADDKGQIKGTYILVNMYYFAVLKCIFKDTILATSLLLLTVFSPLSGNF